MLQLSQFTVEAEWPWTAPWRRPVIAISFSRDEVNSVQYKCVLSRKGANEGLSASEIKGGYSSCWWLIDTQDTGRMSKLPYRATSYRLYFPSSNNCLCICHFLIQDRARAVVKGIHLALNIKRHGKAQ